MKDFVSKYKMKFFRKIFSYGTISKANSINRIFIYWLPTGAWLISMLYFKPGLTAMLAFLMPFLFIQATWVSCYLKCYCEQLKFLRTLHADLNEHNESDRIRREKNIDVDTFYIDWCIDPDEKGDNRKTWQR